MDLFEYAESHACNLDAAPAQNPRRLSAADLPDYFHRIVSVLERHRGKARAITASGIADAAGLFQDVSPANRGTKIRALITRHDDDFPWVLCAGSNGYYVAVTGSDLDHYFSTLDSRIREIARKKKARLTTAKAAGFERVNGHWSPVAH